MNRTIQVPISKEDAKSLHAGDYVLLNGTIYTARDAAHKRMYEALAEGMWSTIWDRPRQERVGRSARQVRQPQAVWTSIPHSFSISVSVQ